MNVFPACTEKLNLVKTDRIALFYSVICALLAVLVVYSFVVRVQMYMLGTSLWLDESLLAENIVAMNMGEMLTPPMRNLQTAPVLYLVVVKSITMLFGASESALRVFSFVCFAGMLVVQWLILRRIFRVRIVFTLFSIAVSSTFLYFMQYSAELKPYMGDALFVLLVLLIFGGQLWTVLQPMLSERLEGLFLLMVTFLSLAVLILMTMFIYKLACARRLRFYDVLPGAC
jgi:predicted membrane-bound mannosyltransferase